MLSTKSDLLAALALRPVEFALPSGDRVLLRPLTARDRLAISAWRKDNPEWSREQMYEQLFARSVCGTDSVPLFALDDAPMVGTMLDGRDVEAVAVRVSEISGLIGDAGKPQSTETKS